MYWQKTIKNKKARLVTISCNMKSKSKKHTGGIKRIDLMVLKGLVLKEWRKIVPRSFTRLPFIKNHSRLVVGSFRKKHMRVMMTEITGLVLYTAQSEWSQDILTDSTCEQ